MLRFILLLLMDLDTDVLTSYAEDTGKSLQHIISLAIAGFAVYVGYAGLHA